MHINDILKVAVERKASDVHLKVGAHPVLRIDGRLQVLTEFKRMMQEDTIAMAFSMMSSRQKERFKHLLETDIAYSVPGMGRFRCNIFQQRGSVGLVLRLIPGQDSDLQGADAAGDSRKNLRGAAGSGAGHRDDRVGKVDLSGLHDRPHQHPAYRARHDHRGPDRVSAPRQEVDHQPARSRRRHQTVFHRSAVGHAAGPGRDSGRRDA